MNNRLLKVKSYFDKPDNYLKKNFDIKLRKKLVKNITGDIQNARILDLGCGDGSISLQYQSETNHITLVDISENMLSIAKQNSNSNFKKNIKFSQSNIENYHSEEKFDFIIGLGILAHVESLEATINKISKLLKTSGTCIVQITDSNQIFSKLLAFYNFILDNTFQPVGYNRNTISLHQIIKISSNNSLKFIQSHQYSLMLPGLIKFLPNDLLYRYHSYIYNNKLLSKFGTDFILQFKKQ